MTEERCPHISAIVTFHGEGLLAHKTLLGLERVRRFTEAQGIIVELVAVLDSADSETTDIVTRCPVLRATDQVLEVNNRDPGVSRNSGVFVARGHCIAIFDGDDFYTKNWLLGR
ncbi:MAG: glycosyltransferase family 2 protein, partial [Candidatus Accumulibacter sp.]|nr:glycosyltransferase family 2 protein [Candidatus Accumulibacter affinis]